MGETGLRIVFMGTPDIAREGLEKLLSLPVEIVGVFTQPDKPVGRKQILTPPPVKALAEEKGIPVYQPKRIKREKWVRILKELAPDLVLVTAYGQILSQEILDIPRLGCINMHASLLPKLRGAAPIQWAIANGDALTGVTAMQMDAGMDTGAILDQRTVPISDDDTEESLYRKLSQEGADLICQIVQRILSGEKLIPVPQDENQVTYAPMISKEDGLINWEMDAGSIDCRVRGFHSWPQAYTFLDGKKLSVLSAAVISDETLQSLKPGEIDIEAASAKRPRLLVGCGNQALQILSLQLQGKKPMAAADFLRGQRNIPASFDAVSSV
ncbi:MAG: methionyl-tRNA formyltransferase [Firmicutes bacterium]|nr:methionyl-tRNA formyltransferase [Bacillota bacterium]